MWPSFMPCHVRELRWCNDIGMSIHPGLDWESESPRPVGAGVGEFFWGLGPVPGPEPVGVVAGVGEYPPSIIKLIKTKTNVYLNLFHR